SASVMACSSCRSATTTFAPPAASWRAQAAPMPEAPPVTMATLPANSVGIPCLLFAAKNLDRRVRVNWRYVQVNAAGISLLIQPHDILSELGHLTSRP